MNRYGVVFADIGLGPLITMLNTVVASLLDFLFLLSVGSCLWEAP